MSSTPTHILRTTLHNIFVLPWSPFLLLRARSSFHISSLLIPKPSYTTAYSTRPNYAPFVKLFDDVCQTQTRFLTPSTTFTNAQSSFSALWKEGKGKQSWKVLTTTIRYYVRLCAGIFFAIMKIFMLKMEAKYLKKRESFSYISLNQTKLADVML